MDSLGSALLWLLRGVMRDMGGGLIEKMAIFDVKCHFELDTMYLKYIQGFDKFI